MLPLISKITLSLIETKFFVINVFLHFPAFYSLYRFITLSFKSLIKTNWQFVEAAIQRSSVRKLFLKI